MSDNSRIEWTEATWNPVTGCTKVSPGCDHCYAETLYNRFHGVGAFDKVTMRPTRLGQPFRWRKPRLIFVNSMSESIHGANMATDGGRLMTATSDECCISGVCDWHNAINQGRPEILLDPRPTGLCHEHGVWSHDDGGDVECCICSRNPCDGVDLEMAIDHARIDNWHGRLGGVRLARQVLSEAMAARAPEPNPVCDAGVETHRAHYALVRGDIDEPPF